MSQIVKILAVDDIEQNIIALEALIYRPGLQLLRANSGAQALELLLENDVALALVDVQMPNMDGFTLAEFMRGSPRTRHVPIIFLTATDRNSNRTFRGYEAGAVDFLYKPFDPHILRSKIEAFVQLQHQKQQLAEQLEQLTQLLRTNELFIAVLGHDLRNPLSAIMNTTEVLLRTNTDPALHSSITRIKNSSNRMSRLVKQLLDIARIRSGTLELTPKTLDLGTLCSTIIDEFELGDAPQHATLERVGDLVGYWDTDRLSQVLSNLLGNAIQHGTPEQPITVKIDGSQPNELTLRVRNAGTIPADVHSRLFQPFSTAAHAREGSGLGLGLYIAKELVRRHHGNMDLYSNTDGQVVFSITLPRRYSPHWPPH